MRVVTLSRDLATRDESCVWLLHPENVLALLLRNTLVEVAPLDRRWIHQRELRGGLMQVRKRTAAMVPLLICLAIGGIRPLIAAGNADPKDLVTQTRKELMRLPYYGVFDFLVFSVNGPTVTLGGEVYNASIKKDAEREVKRLAGVENVVNNIEVLPVSSFDDDIRWATFRAIYHDPSLSRYLPGDGWVPHGRMWRFNRAFDPFGRGMRYPGQEPLGNYPIHIIVNGGRIILEGVVDNQTDKNLAGIRARGVSGAFSVDNELQVEK